MKYDIRYEHLFDDYCKNPEGEYPWYNDKKVYHFKTVVNNANKYKLELSDEDFKLFFELSYRCDISWIMHQMTAYKLSFKEALVSYITY